MSDVPDEVEPTFVAPVEKHGGFTRDHIRLLIARNNEANSKTWATMMTEHTKAVNTRLDEHEATVTGRLDAQDATIGQTLATAQEALAIVKKIDAKGDAWHREDMVFRVTTLSRMQKLETSIKNLRLWIAAVNAAMRLKTAAAALVKEGKQMWVALAALFGAWIAFIQFIHTVWPDMVHPFLLAHHLMKH